MELGSENITVMFIQCNLRMHERSRTGLKEARPRFDVALQLSPFASADIAPPAVT